MSEVALRPRLRAEPEDFVVEEIPSYEPSGEGGHTFVWVEKRVRTTEQAARALARFAGVAPREVGFAGRKDKFAVTRQWLSVPDLDPERAVGFEDENVRVLRAVRHPHKLRTGHLRGNRFELRVRDVSDEGLRGAEAEAETIRRRGFPNAFGSQRFGAYGDNVDRARELLAGARPRDRRTARLLLSALQAEVFNRVLAERPTPLDAVELGDVAFIHESGGRFRVDDVALETPRAASFEISATGPIFGPKTVHPTHAVLAREHAAMAALSIPPPEEWVLARGLRLPGTRRPLRVPVDGLSLEHEGGGCVRLECTLPAGSYVTVLVEALLGEVA